VAIKQVSVEPNIFSKVVPRCPSIRFAAAHRAAAVAESHQRDTGGISAGRGDRAHVNRRAPPRARAARHFLFESRRHIRGRKSAAPMQAKFGGFFGGQRGRARTSRAIHVCATEQSRRSRRAAPFIRARDTSRMRMSSARSCGKSYSTSSVRLLRCAVLAGRVSLHRNVIAGSSRTAQSRSPDARGASAPADSLAEAHELIVAAVAAGWLSRGNSRTTPPARGGGQQVSMARTRARAAHAIRKLSGARRVMRCRHSGRAARHRHHLAMS